MWARIFKQNILILFLHFSNKAYELCGCVLNDIVS